MDDREKKQQEQDVGTPSNLQERLETILTDLDEKFQSRGLYPQETEARRFARDLVSLMVLYEEGYNDNLFEFLESNDQEIIRVLRERLRSIEHFQSGEDSAVLMILDFAKDLKKRTEKLERLEQEYQERRQGGGDWNEHRR